MNTVRITAIRQTIYQDLIAQYENPIEHACSIREGQQWIATDGQCPEGFCPAAWSSMKEFVEALARGEGNFYDGWMQNPMSAMISCNDGFRPFSFYIETIETIEAIEAVEAIEPEPDTTQKSADAHSSQQAGSPLRRKLNLTEKDLPKLPNTADGRMKKLILVIGKRVFTRKQIMAILGLKEKSRKTFIDHYLTPARDKYYIEFAWPGTPSKPVQAYRLTPLGIDLFKQYIDELSSNSPC